MTAQTQILLAIISTIIGSGTLGTVIGFLVYKNRTKAETQKILAEAKNLEAQAASTLSDAVSDIVSGFQNLIKQSEERCKNQIASLESEMEIIKSDHSKLKKSYSELKEDNSIMKENYAKLKASNDTLKKEYALLLSWAKSVADILRDRKIPYPDPPEKLESVIPRNGEQTGAYKL